MKLAGFLLLIAGWAITFAAFVLLNTVGQQTAFVLAGIAIEILGFVLAARAHIVVRSRRR